MRQPRSKCIKIQSRNAPAPLIDGDGGALELGLLLLKVLVQRVGPVAHSSDVQGQRLGLQARHDMTMIGKLWLFHRLFACSGAEEMVKGCHSNWAILRNKPFYIDCTHLVPFNSIMPIVGFLI